MTTLSEKIDAFTTLVDNFAASLTTKLAGLNAATDTANAASAAASSAIAGIGSTTANISIYIDAINGDDVNDGLATASAVKTWQGAFSKIKQHTTARIIILTDLVVDQSVTLTNMPPFIGIYGKNADNSGSETRKITFINQSNGGPYSGGLILNTSTVLFITKIDVDLAYDTVIGPFRHMAGKLDVNFSHGDIVFTGTGGAMFDALFASHFHFYNTTIDASAAGHVIHNIAAQADPNSRAGMTANFTSA